MKAASARELHSAAREGDAERVRWLLEERGMDPNASVELDEGLVQPCFFAAALGGSLDALHVFWERGADLQLRDNSGDTVLQRLERMGLEGAAQKVRRLCELPPPKREEKDEKDWRQLMAQAIAQEVTKEVGEEKRGEGDTREERREEGDAREERRDDRRREERGAERAGLLGELTGRLAAVHAERRELAARDGRLAAEEHALIAQLQLLARFS